MGKSTISTGPCSSSQSVTNYQRVYNRLGYFYGINWFIINPRKTIIVYHSFFCTIFSPWKITRGYNCFLPSPLGYFYGLSNLSNPQKMSCFLPWFSLTRPQVDPRIHMALNCGAKSCRMPQMPPAVSRRSQKYAIETPENPHRITRVRPNDLVFWIPKSVLRF